MQQAKQQYVLSYTVCMRRHLFLRCPRGTLTVVDSLTRLFIIVVVFSWMPLFAWFLAPDCFFRLGLLLVFGLELLACFFFFFFAPPPVSFFLYLGETSGSPDLDTLIVARWIPRVARRCSAMDPLGEKHGPQGKNFFEEKKNGRSTFLLRALAATRTDR